MRTTREEKGTQQQKIDFLTRADLAAYLCLVLIQQGESLAYVKEQMGHHSIRVTVDVYGHLVPGGNKAAVDQLDDPVSENTLPTGNSSEVDKLDSVASKMERRTGR